MHKRFLGICGVLLFCSFGVLSGVAQAHEEPEQACDDSMMPSEPLLVSLDTSHEPLSDPPATKVASIHAKLASLRLRQCAGSFPTCEQKRYAWQLDSRRPLALGFAAGTMGDA